MRLLAHLPHPAAPVRRKLGGPGNRKAKCKRNGPDFPCPLWYVSGLFEAADILHFTIFVTYFSQNCLIMCQNDWTCKCFPLRLSTAINPCILNHNGLRRSFVDFVAALANFFFSETPMLKAGWKGTRKKRLYNECNNVHYIYIYNVTCISFSPHFTSTRCDFYEDALRWSMISMMGEP